MTPSDGLAFVHISDLHLGGQLVNTRFADPAPLGFPVLGVLSGAGENPHDELLCRGLTPALKEVPYVTLTDPGHPLQVVASGDLSATGTTADLQIAHTFLYERVPTNRHAQGHRRGRVLFGLGLPRARVATVPGNHDHWDGTPGKFAKANNPAIFPDHFEPGPWKRTVGSPQGTFCLELFGIDTNSGFQPYEENGIAEGSISRNEFDALEGLLAEVPAMPTVRAIVAHHAFSILSSFDARPLRHDSIHRLLGLADRYRVGVVLTGHTHYFYECFNPLPSGGLDAWELRSAATVQGPPIKALQGFYAHRVHVEPGDDGLQAVWTWWRFQWDGTGFQVPRKEGSIDELDIGASGSCPVPVLE